jgi:hypothetical protein
MLLFRVFRRCVMLVAVLVFVASLALNFSVLTVSGIYGTASAALSGIGVTTVAAREASARFAARKARQKIGRQTTENVTRRAQRGAVHSVTSAGGKSIPVIGLAVVAGALVFEVKDACDTAADMAGLQAALESEGDPELARQRAKDTFDCKEMIRKELPEFTDLPTRNDLWAEIRERPAAAWASAKRNMLELPDFSENYASSMARITVWACMVRPCDTQEVTPARGDP